MKFRYFTHVNKFRDNTLFVCIAEDDSITKLILKDNTEMIWEGEDRITLKSAEICVEEGDWKEISSKEQQINDLQEKIFTEVEKYKNLGWTKQDFAEALKNLLTTE